MSAEQASRKFPDSRLFSEWLLFEPLGPGARDNALLIELTNGAAITILAKLIPGLKQNYCANFSTTRPLRNRTTQAFDIGQMV